MKPEIPMNPHTLRSFDEALDALTAGLVAMGEQTCTMIDGAGRAMLTDDLALARSVVESDIAVDRQFAESREQALGILLRYTPVARDLRRVIAAERAAGNLERMADHAKNTAKRAISTPGFPTIGAGEKLFTRLHGKVLQAVENTVDAFARVDVALAREIIRGDREIDDLHDDLFNTVIAEFRSGDPEKALGHVHLLFATKNLERIGDHATNMAEEILFMGRGEAASATRE